MVVGVTSEMRGHSGHRDGGGKQDGESCQVEHDERKRVRNKEGRRREREEDNNGRRMERKKDRRREYKGSN